MKLSLAMVLVLFSVQTFAFSWFTSSEVEGKLDSLNMGSFKIEIEAPLAAGATETLYNKEAHIPANAVIADAFYIADTAWVSANGNTIKVDCGSATILSATDLVGTATNTYTAATIVGQTKTTYKSVGTAKCDPLVTVGAGASGITAGKVTLWGTYFLK